jgi:hypothetical protein
MIERISATRCCLVALLGLAATTTVQHALVSSSSGSRANVREPAMRYVAVSGHDLEDSARCLPLLSAMVARPHWELVVGSRAHVGWNVHESESFMVSHDGSVEWYRWGMPVRHVVLSPDGLTRFRTLDRLDCAAPDDDDGVERWFTVGLGAPFRETGNGLSAESAAGRELAELLGDAVARYAVTRLAELGPIDVEIVFEQDGRRNAVHIASPLGATEPARLTVTRKGRVPVESPIPAIDFVELVDLVLIGPATSFPGNHVGTIKVNGRTELFAIPHAGLSCWVGQNHEMTDPIASIVAEINRSIAIDR